MLSYRGKRPEEATRYPPGTVTFALGNPSSLRFVRDDNQDLPYHRNRSLITYRIAPVIGTRYLVHIRSGRNRIST